MYDRQVSDIVCARKPSARGEWQTADVENAYIDQGTMTQNVLDGRRTEAQRPRPGETN
jgi:glucose-1-phosphate thymidylyltransferase